jgi:hypothetical protein
MNRTILEQSLESLGTGLQCEMRWQMEWTGTHLVQDHLLRIVLWSYMSRTWYQCMRCRHVKATDGSLCHTKRNVGNEGLRSKSLWRWHINAIIVFLDIIHRPVFIKTRNVSETGFCLHLHVERTQLGPIDWASPYLRMEIESSLRNVVYFK